MDARAVKPLDAGALAALAGLSLVVCEEGIESGGLGQSVRCAMQGKSGIRILSAGDAFYPALAPMRA
jgi:deoxyxylulose-5-phosphate synthase